MTANNTTTTQSVSQHLRVCSPNPFLCAMWLATWISQANEDICNNLQAHNGNFKYLVTMQVMQKKQGGLEGQLTIEGNAHWNSSTDGQMCIRYENSAFYAFVTVFGLAL